MDMQMPELDGIEATRRIRQAGATAVPIIAMTANAFGDDQAACLAAGMNDHVGKPVEPETLFKLLLRWLAPATDAAAASAGPEATPPPAAAARAARPVQERLSEIPGYSLERGLACTGDRVAVLLRLLRTFAATYHVGLPDLGVALQDRRAAAVREAAHSALGACAAVGAVRAADLAQALESAVRPTDGAAVDWPAARELGQRLTDELTALAAALEEVQGA
jgi:CheY-like chemotaxis protein